MSVYLTGFLPTYFFSYLSISLYVGFLSISLSNSLSVSSLSVYPSVRLSVDSLILYKTQESIT